jgi:hypothetical protein
VVDTLMGLGFFLLAMSFPNFFIQMVHLIGRALHHDQLKLKITWMLGYPAGFKPNKHLSSFFGYSLLRMISTWNKVTSALT